MIKTQNFLHQTLDYSQIYNFILNPLRSKKIIEDIFKCFGMEECKLVNITFDVSSKLCKIDKPMTLDEVNKMEGVPYKEAIGCVTHVMIATRLDIIVVIGVVSKFAKS
jgi:hypothetical protein